MKRINLELPDEMFAQVRAAAGDVPVNRWIRRAVEQALGGTDQEPPGSGAASSRVEAAPAERPRPVRSSRQAKDFKPYPKGGK